MFLTKSWRHLQICSLTLSGMVRIVLFLTNGEIYSSRLHVQGRCVRNKHIWQLRLKFVSLGLISFLQVSFLLTFSEKVMSNNFTPEINYGVWVVRLLILVTIHFVMWCIHRLLDTGYAWDTFAENKLWHSWSCESAVGSPQPVLCKSVKHHSSFSSKIY